MQQRLIQEQKSAELIITSELHQLLCDAASITGMTYCCKLTKHTLACINSKDICLSWVQDGRDANLQRIDWIFYYYGSKIHQFGRSLTHGEWVKYKVLASLNTPYMCICGTSLLDSALVCNNCTKKRWMIYVQTSCIGIQPFNIQVRSRKNSQRYLAFSTKNFKHGKGTFLSPWISVIRQLGVR
jgi:hypothetical protein